MQLIKNLLIQLEASYSVRSANGMAYHIEFTRDEKKGAAVHTTHFNEHSDYVDEDLLF